MKLLDATNRRLIVDMVKQSPGGAEFEQFATSLFRLTRSLRATSHLWLQLPGGLKSTDITILKVLEDHGEVRSGFIAEQLHVGASVISRQLVSLGAEDLVVRRKDPSDGRAELVSITDEGRARLAALRRTYVSGMREQFTDWDGDTALRAAQVLDEISDHIIPALGGAGGTHRADPAHRADPTDSPRHHDTHRLQGPDLNV
ncbi:MarR family winged helix-turn-helix transcriptional regulator [Knoellia sp. LjRoot47]